MTLFFYIQHIENIYFIKNIMYSMYNYSTIKLNNILHNYKIYIFISVQKLSYELKFR